MKRAVAVTAVMAVPPGIASAAGAADGVTTPGFTVKAQNPTGHGAARSLRITMTAHSGESFLPDPSCRPKDANLLCWGSLVLKLPDFGGMTLKGFEVHRVAVGEQGGHEGHDAMATRAGAYPVKAQVNGLTTIVASGKSGLPVGTVVQVKLTLTDKGRTPYRDTVKVTVNKFVHGHEKPLVYDSGEQVIQQVTIFKTD